MYIQPMIKNKMVISQIHQTNQKAESLENHKSNYRIIEGIIVKACQIRLISIIRKSIIRHRCFCRRQGRVLSRWVVHIQVEILIVWLLKFHRQCIKTIRERVSILIVNQILMEPPQKVKNKNLRPNTQPKSGTLQTKLPTTP